MKKNSLFNVKVELAKEWHYEKNKDVNPYDESYGSNKVVWWKCIEGHEWEAKIKSRSYGFNSCKECKRNLALQEFKKIAIAKEGECISTKYDPNHKLMFRCKFGHEWGARPTDIKNKNSWCPECSSNKKYTLDDMQEIAAKRRGQCLSTEYINAHKKLEWKCADGHNWFAKPNNIISGGSWCPDCNNYLSEQKCRYIFEIIFGCKFKKDRRILNGLELDGYNESLQLAFEYQGKQHTQHHTFFTKTQKDLDRRIKTDFLKVRKCKELGIDLIVITTEESETDLRLLNYIVKKLKHMGMDVDSCIKNFNFENFYENLSVIKELQLIAKERGGRCLSTTYINKDTKIEWECEFGHIWPAPPHHVKNGSWCPKCSGNQKLGLEEMQKLAFIKKGKCLSTKEEYINVENPLKWECENGHIFEKKPRAIKYDDTWCPDCSTKTKWSIERLKFLAEEKGGKCLSDQYINYDSTYYKWKCGKGHEWEATLASVKKNWCSDCANNKRKTIVDMHELAKHNNGLCLSTEVKNNKDVLLWKCNRGHIFKKRPNDIISKESWCNNCRKIDKNI